MSDTTVPLPESMTGERWAPARPQWFVCFLWTNEEHDRRGQVAPLELGVPAVWGRKPGPNGIATYRQLPGGVSEPGLPFSAQHFSRQQLEFIAYDDHVHVKVVGSCRTTFNGGEDLPLEIDLVEHDLIDVHKHALIMLVKRPLVLPALRHLRPEHFGALGEPNVLGYVCEAPAMVRACDEMLGAAKSGLTVLLAGETGIGKENAARGIHANSSRRKGPFVSRNCATIPDSVLEAEVFGALKGFPNERSPGLPGIFGAAEGGTLFLDEFGELSDDGQAAMLRALEGEKTKLGDPTPRPTNCGIVAATNRPIAQLKIDIPPRFKIHIWIPNLLSRLEDVPFLLAHFLNHEQSEDRATGKKPNPLADGATLTPAIMARIILVMRAQARLGRSGNVRELQGRLLMWLMGQDYTGGIEEAPKQQAVRKKRKLTVNDLDEIRELLRQTGGVVAQVAKRLNADDWNVRYLLKKHGRTKK